MTFVPQNFSFCHSLENYLNLRTSAPPLLQINFKGRQHNSIMGNKLYSSSFCFFTVILKLPQDERMAVQSYLLRESVLIDNSLEAHRSNLILFVTQQCLYRITYFREGKPQFLENFSILSPYLQLMRNSKYTGNRLALIDKENCESN